MLHRDFFIMMAMGGVFLVLGIASFVRGKSSEKHHYEPSPGTDAKGYLESDVEPRSESFKVGGWISIAVGLLLLVMGGVLLLQA